jgi:uncharacterized membrane protein YkvA (DUF1232 family)
MANKRDLISSQNTGFFQDIVRHLKLIGRLMADKRVSFFLKLLPGGARVNLSSPIAIAPGLALPVIGALDDAAILWLGSSLFLSLCPEDVVREHVAEMDKVVDSSWRDAEEAPKTEIVDVQPRDEE